MGWLSNCKTHTVCTQVRINSDDSTSYQWNRADKSGNPSDWQTNTHSSSVQFSSTTFGL